MQSVPTEIQEQPLLDNERELAISVIARAIRDYHKSKQILKSKFLTMKAKNENKIIFDETYDFLIGRTGISIHWFQQAGFMFFTQKNIDRAKMIIGSNYGQKFIRGERDKPNGDICSYRWI